MLLDDTALLKVKVRYPNDVIREYKFDNDTLRFTPAESSNGTKDNTATLNFKPAFAQDGFYELIVTGKDRSGNNAGLIEYKVTFSIVNKPMISNLLNYPNPFVNYTEFWFTHNKPFEPLEVQVQVMTITGKLVWTRNQTVSNPETICRDIKWDGKDDFGDRIGKGVYIYKLTVRSVLSNSKTEKYEKLVIL
jgi:hypothetical protein